MSLGPQARIVNLQKKTSLSQLLNPSSLSQLLNPQSSSSSSSSSVPSAYQVPQIPQAYSNVSYDRTQSAEYDRYTRVGDGELVGTNNRYYEQNGGQGMVEWGAGAYPDGRSAIFGDRDYSNDQQTHQPPSNAYGSLLVHNHHHQPMGYPPGPSPYSPDLQQSERASTRIQARNTIEPPPNYYEPLPVDEEYNQRPQGEPSRKRNTPPTTSTSRPKKSKKTDDPSSSNSRTTSAATSSNPAKRGFNHKKRNEAATLRTQNAYLIPTVTYMSEKGKGPASENRMNMVPADSQTTYGKLTPDLQTARCMSSKYRSEEFPRCVSCTRRWAGDTCRFQGIRIFLKNEKKEIVGMSFVNNQKAEKPTMNFPSSWNVKLSGKDISRTLRVTARQLLPVLQQERKHVDTQQIIYRPRECDVRATCDTCMTSLFCCSWMCRLCGRESCADCYEQLILLTADPNAEFSESTATPEQRAEMASRTAAQQRRKEQYQHSNPFFLSCTKRLEHRASDFSPVSRFCLKELDEAIKGMEVALREEEEGHGLEANGADDAEGTSSGSESTGLRTPPDLGISVPLGPGTGKDMGFTTNEVRYPDIQTGYHQQPYRPYNQHQALPHFQEQQAPHGQSYVSQLQTAHAPHLTSTVASGYHHSHSQSQSYVPQQQQYSNTVPQSQYHTQQSSSSYPSYDLHQSSSTFQTQAPALSPSRHQHLVHTSTAASSHHSQSSLNIPQSSQPSYPPSSLYLPHTLHNTHIPLHVIPTHSFASLTPSAFQVLWSKHTPMLITGVGERFRIQWTPEYFIEKYGDQACLIVECQTDTNKRVTVGDFFTEFGKYGSRGIGGGGSGSRGGQQTESSTTSTAASSSGTNSGAGAGSSGSGPGSESNSLCGKGEIWKLKDWPPSADFKSTFPELYEDFSQAVPAPNYVRRDGTLNIASHFPENVLAPDLGPKMYNAMASSQAAGSRGSTRLHMDMADALNIMTYAADCPDGSPGCAAWDLFRAEDSVTLRAYLKKKMPGAIPTDPIHGQQVYLDDNMRKELAQEWGVWSFRVYQRPGEAIFIPAGCAHQVCNLADCIKVAIDFVSPENVERCEQLTREFREQNQSKVWKEDVLQLKSMMWFAWLSCCQQQEEQKRLRIRASPSSVTVEDERSS